jgi:superfamily II DNA or RNA helicase
MIELTLSSNGYSGQINTDPNTLALIRENFSIKNPAHRGRNNRFAPSRLYCITPSGKFELGMLKNISSYLDSKQSFYNIDTSLEKKFNVGFSDPIIKKYSMIYRDHQEKSIKIAIEKGRGVICIPTAGGKTLIMAGIIESMRLSMGKPNAKALVIVPSLQLVTQSTKDFEDYGMEKVTKWSGDNIPDPNATTIVAGTQILLSEKSDLSILDEIDILLVDEVHGLRKGNEINKVLQLVNTDYKFGFTGTLPPSLIDQWNIIGKIGSILYQEKTSDLQDKKYVSNFKIMILEVMHNNIPTFHHNEARPSEAYEKELEFLTNNSRRNEIITNLALKVKNNTIIMVDRIEHGILIEELLKNKSENDRPVYFIRGSMEMEEREKIRSLMEDRSDVIVVAISKIFSTGINIPNLHNIIFASAGKAKIKIMQSIGRALRLHPTKEMANIFDIADNTKYGRRHLNDRIVLYTTEKYNYEKTNIQ